MVKSGLGKLLKHITKRETVGLIILAVLLTATLRTGVNMLVDRMLPMEEVTIRRADNVAGRCIFILYEEYAENKDELFLALKEENEKSNAKWEYVESDRNESWTMLYSTDESSEITVSTKLNPRKYVTFMANAKGGAVEIESSKGKLVYNTSLRHFGRNICTDYLQPSNGTSCRCDRIRGLLSCQGNCKEGKT